ncbi:leucine-rich repeat-containing protein 9 [Myripristis murdjan]|uniref:leucine-rich repeat-containing protein 9 n=1 Tax=Myripristis murdjan TaxID=586833 RepID=UPI0011761AE5|nr:leucine-rich repeat-containing protein 9 [Myripristis murdjan]
MAQGEKPKQRGDEEAVKELCIVNGLSYEKIAEDGSTISSLEVFFSGYARMVGLSLFPRLCQLTLVGQSISHIQGLECCPLLQELWVVECQLTGISGLQNCPQLQKLYLYDNQISEIQNLELQVNLQVLWLNNNCISHIKGLNTLKKLKELNLADNSIEKIGHGLDANVNLENLNLSGNKISSFKELTLLAHLPHLRKLGLRDPQSTPNPVCLLCNYATHILYHMPGLQRLDSYDVSSKQMKEAAECMVMKKMMYYNMRVHTAQRNLAETQASLMEQKNSLLQLPEDCIRTLNYALKNLECELSEVQARCRKSARTWEDGPSSLSEGSVDSSDMSADICHDSTLEHKMLSKMEALRERLKVWNRRIEAIDVWYGQELAEASNRKEYMVNFLLIELETVGNIRFEQGSSKDPWFTPCHDLLLSRFSATDCKSHGITGIKITCIIRIHNRALRLRFEDKLHSLITSEESAGFSQNYKRWLEYLFYVADPKRTSDKNETLHILEEGFPAAETYKALGRESAVPLSNSLNVCEQPRIEYALSQAGQSLSNQHVDSLPFRHGRIIVSKVFLGHRFSARLGEPIDSSNYPKAHSVYCNVNSNDRATTSDERRHSPKTHSGPECSPRRRQWFVFDHELVLPEYIIDFEYITEHQGHSAIPDLGTSSDDVPSNDISLDQEALTMEPVLKPQPKMLSLDEKTLLRVARANVLSQITVLNLHGNSLSKLKEISCLTALRHLTISFNKFTRLDDISHMHNLEFVDASYNLIVTLDGLKGLGRLKQLDLSWNKLTKAREETAVLRKHTPALLKLDTRHNPWHRPEAVRMTILGRLMTLTHLDDVLVTEEEAAAAVQMAAASKINQASLLAHSRTVSERPRSLSLLSAAQLLCQLGPAPWGLNRELEPGWTAEITALNLDSQRISKLTNLDKLVNLRWASFNDNDISKVEGLDNCLHLEELSLNNNCISTLDGLSKLHCLIKLSVNGNQLSCLDASVLDQLPHLHFLSVENNCIKSMHGIQRARSLLELYIGSNHISTTRDIYHLKGLTNLIILDLYGNPLVEKLENYRIYVVFQLPSLKALDGIAVETVECENAKDVFGGRLTPDMVAEKLGHSNYAEITNLSLQSCLIRMVDLAPIDLFHNLHTVNLEHNNLTSFSGLIYLPNIKALCLNYNHIESILPRQRTGAHLTNRQILYNKVNSSGYGQQSPSKGNRDAGPMDSLEPLMGSLEVLYLSHNGISNMANLQLSRLTNLKALFLQGNEISQVEGLEGLYQLRELVLDRNRIKSFAENSFIAQNVLIELHLAENRIRELNHLEPLTELCKLFLCMNKLQDIAELEKLEVLPSLTELSVVGNPVARRSLHRPSVVLHLSRLQVLDGAMVTLEERTRAELLLTDVASYSQCPGASVPTMDMNLPGLLPPMSRNTTLRSMGLSGGLQNILVRDILPCNVNEVLPHDISRHKKHKHGSAARSSQAEIGSRHIRRTGNSLPTTSLLLDVSRVNSAYPYQEQDNRFPNSGVPKPPPM